MPTSDVADTDDYGRARKYAKPDAPRAAPTTGPRAADEAVVTTRTGEATT